MIKLPKLEKEPSTDSIAIYLSAAVDNYILSENSNRSEWIREAGEQFLEFIKEEFIDDIDAEIEGHKIVSISKPPQDTLGEVYHLVHNKAFLFSRSEFYRMSIFYKIIMQVHKRSVQTELNRESEDPNTVRVPISRDSEGNHVFKAYKILKRVEW